MSELLPGELVRAWEALHDNLAWQTLVSEARGQLATRERTILYGTLLPDEIYDREKLRGEHNGIELILRMAEEMYEQAKADLETVMKEQENEQQI